MAVVQFKIIGQRIIKHQVPPAVAVVVQTCLRLRQKARLIGELHVPFLAKRIIHSKHTPEVKILNNLQVYVQVAEQPEHIPMTLIIVVYQAHWILPVAHSCDRPAPALSVYGTNWNDWLYIARSPQQIAQYVLLGLCNGEVFADGKSVVQQ